MEAIKAFRPYLESNHFTVCIDNITVKWLQTAQNLNSRIGRWARDVKDYNFTINAGQVYGIRKQMHYQEGNMTKLQSIHLIIQPYPWFQVFPILWKLHQPSLVHSKPTQRIVNMWNLYDTDLNTQVIVGALNTQNNCTTDIFRNTDKTKERLFMKIHLLLELCQLQRNALIFMIFYSTSRLVWYP